MATQGGFFGGIDIGTTGCRVSVYGMDGQLACSSSAEYPLHTPRVGVAEQDPEQIFEAVRKTFTEAMAQFPHPQSELKAFTFSSVLHSFFPVSAEGKPLHPMLTFADSRAQDCLPHIEEQMDTVKLYQRTGCPLHPMYPLAKLVWFRREMPELFAKAHKFVSIKEFVLFRLTGEFQVDMSLASGTGYFNNQTLAWDEECLRLLGTDTDKLSPIFPTVHVIPEWKCDVLGLEQSIPLVLGAGDGMLSTLGAGAAGPNQFTAMIGTSGAVRLCVDRPITDPESKNWCYNLKEDVWVIGGAINNGGLAFRWARDKFAANEQYVAEKLNLDAYEVLSRYAEQKPAGSDGLVFLPFLTGERSPHWNANARGVLFGLTVNHGKRHLMRATLEGVLYSMYSVFQSLRKLAPNIKAPIEVRASGSFARSPVWVQMMADVFGCPIVLPSPPEGSAFGAAALGMLAMGYLSSISEIRHLVGKPKSICVPNQRHHLRYQKLFSVYERVYRNLVGEFDEISRIQRELSEEEK